MGTQQDVQIVGAIESTYGTAVTATRAVEFTDEDLDYMPEYVQGAGLRVGKRMALSTRRALGKETVGGSFTVEGLTKGLGWLFQAALGTGASTLVSTGAYQQVFTPTTTDYLPSYTIQKGVPLLGGGAASTQTYAGMVCSGFELTAGNGEIPTIKFNWGGKSHASAVALATATYPTGVQELTFVNAALTIGGAVTPPTATALASGGTATVNIREFDLTWDNKVDDEGFTFGGAGQRVRPPALGLREGTGSFTAEYTNDTLRDAYKNQTDLGVVLTYQLPNVAGNLIGTASYPTLQITIPNIRLEGEMPKAAGGDVITQSIDYTVLDGGVAAQPIYVAIVTAETAI